MILEYRAARRAIPGYGHPLHKGADPRAQRLFAVAARSVPPAAHVEIARQVERLLPDLIGKPLALNVSGAIPAVLLDAGYPLVALKGVPHSGAHRGPHRPPAGGADPPDRLRDVCTRGAAAIDYDGESPPDFDAEP